MTEEQRVKLENLITDFEVTVVTANADVVDDFTQYLKDWANRRSEDRPGRAEGI